MTIATQLNGAAGDQVLAASRSADKTTAAAAAATTKSQAQTGGNLCSRMEFLMPDKDAIDQANASSPIKCSAVHTLERDMPDFDYSPLIREMRERVLKHSVENPGTYSELDLQKCKEDDWFLARYLLRQKMDIEAATSMLVRALRFRHESLTNCIKAQDFPSVFYKLGGLFHYERDRKGNLMVYMRVGLHRKVPEIQLVLEAFIYFTINWADEAAKGRGIVIVFDCTGGGLASADMDTLLSFTTVLKNYFPKGLSYLLVHELPWILKPFWYIAKMWVPEEYKQMIKFSDSRTIFEYCEKEKLPDFMGGTCERDYCAVPENCTTLQEAVKLWGVHPDIARRILKRFAEFLPADWVQQSLDALEEAKSLLEPEELVSDESD